MSEDRVPDVPPELWPGVRKLLRTAFRAPLEERAALFAKEDPAVVDWAQKILASSAGGLETRRASPTEGAPEEKPPPELGDLVADRYTLLDNLGSGSFGEVFEAEDRAGGSRVAIKFLRYRPDDIAFERELATLRVLDLPGVVPLIDAFEWNGQFLLVMERLEGSPFPGDRTGLLWESIEEPVLSLLEAVERLHAAGFVHGDLKPTNILVDARGRSSILDLGLARRWRDASDGSRHIGLGAPLFLAPEVLEGHLPTPAADLYSIGVMIDHALGEASGIEDSSSTIPLASTIPSPPKQEKSSPAEPPPARTPIDRRISGLPERAVRLIEGLLRPLESRIGSATEAIETIGVGSVEQRLFPHSIEPEKCSLLEDALADLEQGKSVDWQGPGQSGRTRALHELAAALTDRGVTTALISNLGLRAWLTEFLDPAELAPLGSEREAETLLTSRVERFFDEGGVLLIDDADRLDGALAEQVTKWRSRGPVVRVGKGAANRARFAAWSEEALQALFDGPELVLHLPSDAARALFLRTGGSIGRVAREISSWYLAGLVEPSDAGRFKITRESIDRLEILPGTPLRPTTPRELEGLDSEDLRLAAFLQLAGGRASLAFLAHCDRRLSSLLEAKSTRLIDRGLLIQAEGQFVFEGRVPLSQILTPKEIEHAHAWLETHLDRTDPARLGQLAAADRPQDIPPFALAIARAEITDGRAGRAHAILREGLRAATRAQCDEGVIEDLIAELVEAALLVQDPGTIESTLHEITFASASETFRTTVHALCNFAIALLKGDRERVLKLGSRMATAPNDRWERWRARLLALAGQFFEKKEWTDHAIGQLSKLAEGGDSAAVATLGTVLGEQAYQQDRPEDAVVFHGRAVDVVQDAARRTASLLSVANAALESGQYDVAGTAIDDALELATSRRLVLQEARALAMRSILSLRIGAYVPVPKEALRAMEALSAGRMLWSSRLAIAVHAYRSEDKARALECARSSAEDARSAGFSIGELLSTSLAVAAGDPIDSDAWNELLERAEQCPLPGVAIQAVALLLATPDISREIPVRWSTKIPLLESKVPLRLRELPREVLSVREAITLIRERMSR